MLRTEQNLPARSRKRGEAPDPYRVGKGVPGFGIEHAPSREGVSALDHQATPAAQISGLFAISYTCSMVWCIWQVTQRCSGTCLMPQGMHQEVESWKSSINLLHGFMHCPRRLELLNLVSRVCSSGIDQLPQLGTSLNWDASTLLTDALRRGVDAYSILSPSFFFFFCHKMNQWR
jgi:hypothetical protein